jgi:spore coat protein U-like protein
MSFLTARFAALAATGAFALATPLVAGATVAPSNSANLNVTGSVAAQCTSLTAVQLAFAPYGPITDNSDTASASESIACTNGAKFAISVSDGTKGSNCSTGFALTDGASPAHYLCYGLYGDPVYSVPVPSTIPFTGQGASSPMSSTVYGKIVPGQGSAYYGSYTDTVTFTIAFTPST